MHQLGGDPAPAVSPSPGDHDNVLSPMTVDRRNFLKMGGVAALAASVATATRSAAAAAPPPAQAAAAPADHVIRIGTGLVELAPEMTISTKTYNGQFPGPLLRLTEGRPVTVDVHNDTDTPELLHWHG